MSAAGDPSRPGDEPEAQWICHRCGRLLEPGRGDFYVVRIDAVADPTPPHFDEADLQGDLRQQMRDLIESMADQSEQELADQVYRRLTLTLCRRCFTVWIEKPV